MALKVILVACSTVLTILFFLYGFNCYYLLSMRRRYRCPETPPLGIRPRVAIHLPVYNEKYVVCRLLRACARMVRSYGPDRARIVVIDDSDDDTAQAIDRMAALIRRVGVCVDVLRRPDRAGFKAGALQLALDLCPEEYIAVFDADFAPQPSFLEATLPFLVRDERLGVVQCRWEHMNSGYNVITRAVALGIDAHFFVEQPARLAAGCFLNFNGSAGVIRAEALRKAGGWQADTLCEDLDASYRMQMAGYRILYLRDVAIPSEIPPTLPSFRRQQARWACGSLRTAKKLLPRLLADRSLGGRRRLQGLIHLTGYLVHPLMFVSFLLGAATALFNVGTPWRWPALAGAVIGSAIAASTLAPWLYPLAVLRTRRVSIVKNLPAVLVLGLLGFGICLSNTVEAVKALFSKRLWSFRRTPKYAIQQRDDDWGRKVYQVARNPLSLLEAALAVVGILAAGWAFARASYLLALPLAFYAAAFSFVVIMTLLQGRREAGG